MSISGAKQFLPLITQITIITPKQCQLWATHTKSVDDFKEVFSNFEG